MRKAAVALDLAAVLIFVGIGRDVHAHGLSVAGLASTAWPFLSGLGVGWLGVGWLALRGRRLEVASLRGGLVTWIATVAFGMTLRVISGQGIALAFVVVALAFLGATMLGWRVMLMALTRPTATRWHRDGRA